MVNAIMLGDKLQGQLLGGLLRICLIRFQWCPDLHDFVPLLILWNEGMSDMLSASEWHPCRCCILAGTKDLPLHSNLLYRLTWR